jgi:hypothetical protein
LLWWKGLCSSIEHVIDTRGSVSGLCDVSEQIPLAEELAQTPPGVRLHRVLAGADRLGLDADELLELATARQRLIAHQEAQLLADLHAVARRVPAGPSLPDSVSRRAGRYPWAEVESALALRWTHGRAAAQMQFADEVIDRLPRLFTALDTGQIDVPKARVVADLLGCVDDDLAAALVDRVIEQASRLTTAQLRARLRRLLIAVDPQAAAARARQGISERRVAAYGDDGTHLAALAGYELAPHRVAAVMERLDAIARASKAAGDGRSMDQLRADAFLDLLSGEGIATGGPVSDGALGLAGPHSPPEPDPVFWPVVEPEPEPGPGPGPGPDFDLGGDPGATGMPADPEGVVDLWAAGIGPPPPPECTGEPDGPDAGDMRRWLAAFDRLPTTRPATRCVLCGQADGTPPAAGPLPAPRPGTVEVVVSLDTLLGHSDLPAELPGIGPVTAQVARQAVRAMPDARWRFSIYDSLGRLAHHGTSGARAARSHPGPDDQDPGRRRPGAELAAYIKARDRACVAPGCRRTARRCDIDHTVDWAQGGETIHSNLGLLCRLHHLFKHATGCELEQPTPGLFLWRTPAGMHYRTRSDLPIIHPGELVGLDHPGG